jgi:transcriptional regulator with GAF, ATPase, and Fis domain
LEDVRRLQAQLQQENFYLHQEMKSSQGQSRLIGQSPALLRVLTQVEQVAPTASSVLLLGETGTGKELFATAIHDGSPRRDRAMVRVNCAAIPAALIESELFGREKGAYTGALARQIGRFEMADGSTLFLDEISELPPESQGKLLRVLQERELERLGSPKRIKVNVRVIAATNRDLAKAVAEGRFREDLYYRLNVFPITAPPLRERREDVPLLVWAFVDEFSKAMGKPIEAIAKASLRALQAYDWPGNVRELRNVIERAMILANGATLRIDPPGAGAAPITRGLVTLAEAEREHIQRVLDATGWRIRGTGGAAGILGLKPTTLESRMAKLGLRRRSPNN